MLDLGLTKMALIGVVALVVLGPERLPRVARTAGALFGRAQRYINDVKAEVTREMELEELRRVKTEFESAARNVENTIHDTAHRHEAELNEAWREGMPSSPSIESGVAQASLTGTADTASSGYSSSSDGGSGSWRTSGAALATKRRRNWRTKRTATPVWYKRAVGQRAYVQSGAARVAQHTPASLRRPVRFF